MDERSEAYLDAALERSWITPEQAAEARRISKTVAEVGIKQRIEDILVKKGYLTPERARRLSRELTKRKVGKYEIIEKIGEGGAGIVYKANQEPLERVVAIKVLSAERTLSSRYLERFMREARIAVTLNHQNIVRGLDYGESDGYHYFVMEYVKGDSLYHVLGREGTLTEKRALRITLQVVHALEHAAKYDLVHRDIKPENILLTDDDSVKLCDLGLAKPSLVETAKASKDGTTIGTPTYMSPEQIRGKDEADFRSDIYSLGATLYHMITGRPPFVGESADIVVRKHLRDAVTDPRELNVTVSASTAAIVHKMLAKKPSDRYGSLGSLREDLEAVLEGRPPRNTIELGGKRPTGAVHVDLADSHHRRTRIDRPRRSLAPLLIGIVVVLLAAGAGAFLLLSEKQKEGPPSPGPDEPTGPVTERVPTEDEKAEEEYRSAVDWCERNPRAAADTMIAKYRSVAIKYPESRWGLHAKERIQEIEERREEAKRRRLEKAKRIYEETLERAEALVAQKHYGDAILELSTYPEEYADTEFPARLERDADRFEKDAEREFRDAVEKADYATGFGRFDEAIALLEPFLAYGIESIEKDARERSDRIRGAREEVVAARKRGQGAFRAVVGEAFLKAARGEWGEARNHLVESQGRSDLVYFQDELTRIDADLREAMRFADAIRKGARELIGKVERLQLAGDEPDDVAGKILEITDSGIRMTKTGGTRDVEFGDLSAEERVRLAFLALDNDSVDDHRAAALYLILHAEFGVGNREIESAKILGSDPGRLVSTRDLYVDFLKGHADRFVRQARVRIAQERWQEAYEQLEQAVERAPWYGVPRLYMGQTLVKLGREEDGIAALEKAIELGVTDPEVHYWLGEAWFELEKAGKALDAYTKFADSTKDGDKLEKVRQRINELRERALAERVESLLDEAKSAQRRKDWDRVVAIYREVLELDPKDAETLYLLGKAQIERQEILGAYDALTRFLDTDPRGREASDAKKLLRNLKKAYTENQDTPRRLADASQQLEAMRLDGALTLCEMVIADSPLNEDAYYTRAMVYYRMGQKSEDETDFAACLENLKAVEILNPSQPLVYELRAIAYYYLKKPEEALANAELGMEKMPGRWQSYNVAGLVHHEQGRDDKAIQVLTAGMAKAPDEALLYLNRALAWETMKRYDRGIEDVRTALTKKPSSSQINQLNEMLKRMKQAKQLAE
jgi:serine/threonine-protein kinase